MGNVFGYIDPVEAGLAVEGVEGALNIGIGCCGGIGVAPAIKEGVLGLKVTEGISSGA